jgi:hypothetical protein
MMKEQRTGLTKIYLTAGGLPLRQAAEMFGQNQKLIVLV